MKWTEITVHTTTFGSELVADVFFNMGASGVVIKDRQDVIATLSGSKMWDYVDDSLLCGDEVVLVKAFVTDDLKDTTMERLQSELVELKEFEQLEFPIGSLEILSKQIDDEDWINIWKQHYKPIPVGKIVICPKWIKYQAQDSEKILLIDPGMAFGTGEHETTRLCIELSQQFDLKEKTVLDVGCGSGILAISALKLGASHATLIDFDPQAVTASNLNAELNCVSDRCKIICGDLLSNVEGCADIIFANITADILLRLGRDIMKYTKSGGAVILSGLIHKRVDEVEAFYTQLGLQLKRKATAGEWNALAFSVR